MKPEFEIGKFASWISAPDKGIDNQSGDFEYVKIHDAQQDINFNFLIMIVASIGNIKVNNRTVSNKIPNSE